MTGGDADDDPDAEATGRARVEPSQSENGAV